MLGPVMWVDHYPFSDPLRDVRRDEAEQLKAELLSELSPGHPLYGVDLRIIAQALPQDEVIVQTGDGGVALVHMTWSGHAESPPWPITEVVDSAEHLDQLLRYRY
jgi:hypothetical protein